MHASPDFRSPTHALVHDMFIALTMCGALGLVLLNTSCRNDSLPAPEASSVATLTAAETTVVVGDVEFYFPKGTVEGDTEVTLRVATAAPVPLPAGRARSANVVEIFPHDLPFLRPVQIRSPAPTLTAADVDAHAAAPSDKILRAHHLPTTDAVAWQNIEAEFEAGSVRLKSTHAGFFAASVEVAACLIDVSPPQCESIADFPNCEGWSDGCPSGEVVGAGDDGCIVCVPEPVEAQTCDEVKSEMLTLLDRNISRSCANYCETDDDCYSFRLESACDDGCYSLFGSIDEEPLHAFIMFAEQRCGVCGDEDVRIRHVGGGTCEQSQCHFPEDLAEAEGSVFYENGSWD